MTNTPAFGGAVEQFADFGVLGVIFWGFFSAQSFVTALLSYLLFRRPGVRLTQMNVATTLVMVMQYAPGFGAFFPGALYVVLVAFVALTVLALRRKRRVRAAPPSSSAAEAPL